MAEQVLSIKDAIGLVADTMTLFGISGFFAWSFIRKSVESRDLAGTGITVFAYSVKAFMSLVFLLLLSVPAFFTHLFVVLAASGDYSSTDGIWNGQKTVAYAAAYLVTALWAFPIAVLGVSCIFTWSFEPITRFMRAFREKREHG
jgi:hypothetical protein